MGRARGQAFWASLVSEVEQGATMAQVAAKHGVAGSALGLWARRLRERPSTALLPVRVTEGTSRRVEMEVDGVRLVLFNAEPDYVAAVARACRQR